MVLCVGIVCATILGQDRSIQVGLAQSWRQALKQTETRYINPLDDGGYTIDERSSDSFSIDFADCSFTFEKGTNRFMGFYACGDSQGGQEWGQGTLSQSEALGLAIAFRNVFLGFTPSVAEIREPILNIPPCYQVRVTPTVSGIPCYPLRYSAHVLLEHHTGKLKDFTAPYDPPPMPPDNLTPLIEPTEAAVTAGCYLTQNVSDPPPVMEIEPTILTIFCPPDPDLEPQNFLTPQQRADVLANKGILAFRVAQTRLDEYVPALGEGPWNYSYVHARTGQLLMVYSATKYLAGGGPPPGMLSLGRFQWDIGPQKIEVVVGRRSRAVASAKIERTSRSYKGKGISVQLKLGKLLVPASFDRTSGLLKHGSSCGIPDKRLKDVLLELTSKPLHPIRVPKYKRNIGPEITPKR